MKEIDLFWSFRSPWSYLATPRLVEWEKQYDLQVNFRPVYPIAIRTPEFFDRVHLLWGSYFMRDVFRVAEFLGLTFVWPSPDPVIQLRENGRPVTAEDQPYIHRLTRLGAAAEEQGKGLEFADEVSRLLWGGTKDWHLGEHLAEASERAGLNLAELDRIALDDEQRLEGVIEQNQVDHEAAGHWGVPTTVYDSEPFFGQDRLDVLLWRLQQSGLEER